MVLENLRNKLIRLVLKWETLLGVAPHITGAISEYDAMRLIGMSEEEILKESKGKTAVQRGHDFIYRGIKYQVKANRPSGKKGSFVTLTSKPKNYKFDKLIWILYDSRFVVQEAYICNARDYERKLGRLKNVRPKDIREIGRCISI